jgi:hypothetical protein
VSFSRDTEAGPRDADDDRPTVLPPFDADAFARESEMSLRSARPADDETTTDEARRLLLEGQPEEALFLLAPRLETMPKDAEARLLSNECSAALERDCWSAIGSGSAIFGTTASAEELKGFALDHVSGFLLSLMDGVTDVDLVLDICGLPRLLALRHLRRLVVRGIVIEKRRAPPG